MLVKTGAKRTNFSVNDKRNYGNQLFNIITVLIFHVLIENTNELSNKLLAKELTLCEKASIVVCRKAIMCVSHSP